MSITSPAVIRVGRGGRVVARTNLAAREASLVGLDHCKSMFPLLWAA